MSQMYNPPHPGETLREDIFPALGLTVSQAAEQLKVARATLSSVLHGRVAISPEMALRLECWLGVENGAARTHGSRCKAPMIFGKRVVLRFDV